MARASWLIFRRSDGVSSKRVGEFVSAGEGDHVELDTRALSPDASRRSPKGGAAGGRAESGVPHSSDSGRDDTKKRLQKEKMTGASAVGIYAPLFFVFGYLLGGWMLYLFERHHFELIF